MNLLVTAVGSMSADCVITSLSNAGLNVYGCDVYPKEWHAVTKKCVLVQQSPLAVDEERYIDFLLEMSKKNNIEYILPLTDIEIDLINKNRQVFDSNGIVVCISSENTLTVVRHKYELYLFFKNDTLIPSLETYKSGEGIYKELDFPYIAKPCNGRSSEGVYTISNTGEFQEALIQENYIIQKKISGRVFTVDYVRSDKYNSDFMIPREELLRTKNGAGTTVEITNNETLKKYASYVGEKLRVNGCVNMEFIKNENSYYLIDINPRFSAGVAFSFKIGYDMPLSHFNCFRNKDIIPPIAYEDGLMTKVYKEEML